MTATLRHIGHYGAIAAAGLLVAVLALILAQLAAGLVITIGEAIVGG